MLHLQITLSSIEHSSVTKQETRRSYQTGGRRSDRWVEVDVTWRCVWRRVGRPNGGPGRGAQPKDALWQWPTLKKRPNGSAWHITPRPGDSDADGNGSSERLTAGPECLWAVEVSFSEHSVVRVIN